MKRPLPPALQPLTGRLGTVRARYGQLAENLRGLEVDLRWGLQDSDRIPKEWAEIAAEAYCPLKEKLSLRVDEDVLRFFRATGQGYLTRMNKVLRTYMLARLAGVVQGAEREMPGPTLLEEQMVANARYLDLQSRRAVLARGGHDVADLEAEIESMEPRLAWLERELGGE